MKLEGEKMLNFVKKERRFSASAFAVITLAAVIALAVLFLPRVKLCLEIPEPLRAGVELVKSEEVPNPSSQADTTVKATEPSPPTSTVSAPTATCIQLFITAQFGPRHQNQMSISLRSKSHPSWNSV